MIQELIILGFDPGLGGGIGAYCPGKPQLSQVFDMPLTRKGQIDVPRLAASVRSLSHITAHAVVEQVHSRPRQSGAFNFGVSCGVIHGVLAGLNVPYRLVPASVWKIDMGLQRRLDETQADTKTRARALATKLFPHLEKEFSRVKDDGRAEALLLAMFAAHS